MVNSKKTVFDKFIKRYFGIVSSIIGAVLLLYELITTWKQSASLINWTIIGVGSLLILSWLGMIIFSTKKEIRDRKIALPGRKFESEKYSIIVPRYNSKLRTLAKIALGVFLLCGVCIGYIRLEQRQVRIEKFIILLTTIDGPNPKEYGITDQLILSLKDELTDYPYIVLETIPDPVTESQGSEHARKLGKNYQADLVIWGWYNATTTDTILTLHLENLNELNIPHLDTSEFRQVRAPVAELETFNIQAKLGSDLRNLVTFISGFAHYNSERFTQALSDFDKITVIDNKLFLNPSIFFFYRGNTKFFLDEIHLAIEDFNQAIEFNPDFTEAYISRGIIHLYMDEEQNAIDDFDRALEINPLYELAYLDRGTTYAHLGQYQKAIEDYDQALDINPEYAEVYNNRGNAYAKLEQYTRAIEDYNQAIKINPALAEAYINRGETYFDIEQYIRAIDDFDQALEINPDRAKVYINRGNAYSNLEQYMRAIEDYDQAVYINPSLLEAYINRGATYADMGQYMKAIDDFDQALEIDPNFLEAYHNRGTVYFSIGQYERAIEDFDQALNINSYAAEVYNNRGNAYAKLGQNQKAIEDYDQAIEIKPDYTIAYINRGNLYAKFGFFGHAILDFDKVIELNPQNVNVYIDRGKAYAAIGAYESAESNFLKALDYCQSDLDCQRAGQYLEDLQKLLK